MHEFAVCQSLLNQVHDVAIRENASEVIRITLHIGPLAGIEPDLLDQAFSIARAGTLAEKAELVMEEQPVRVRCSQCDALSEASINRLVCAQCGDYRTQVISGDELLLARVEINRH